MFRKHSFTRWIPPFILCLILIVFNKTVDNFNFITDALGSLWGILTPVIIGFCLAYLINRPAHAVTRFLAHDGMPRLVKRCARGLGILSIYLLLLLIIGFLLGFGIPAVTNSLAGLMGNVGTYYTNLQNFVSGLSASGGVWEHVRLNDILDSLSVESIIGFLNLDNIGVYVSSIIGISGTFVSILTGVFLSVYMLLEKGRILGFINRLLGAFMQPPTMDKLHGYADRANEIFHSYIYGVFINACIMGLLAAVALYFIGVPYAIIMGLIVGIFSVIPYFGGVLGAIPVVLFTLVSAGPGTAIWAGVALAVIPIIDGNVIAPRIISGSLGISPFWTIIAVTVGGGLFGMAGMVLCVPVLAVIRVLVKEYLSYREKRTGERERRRNRKAGDGEQRGG